ncbi:MAG: hypothetical protein U5K33_03280 [Halofilum sp. (in: g-proteobacteria)]|nr:hypothetical protein [Halofilum sp. (in: g-proteobacteria)]
MTTRVGAPMRVDIARARHPLKLGLDGAGDPRQFVRAHVPGQSLHRVPATIGTSSMPARLDQRLADARRRRGIQSWFVDGVVEPDDGLGDAARPP